MNNDILIGFVVFILISIFIGVGMWGLPKYKVYKLELVGKAKLAEATQTRKIQIEQANAELESSRIRAEAIQVIGEAAKKYPEYRLQEFIGAFSEALQEGTIDQIIYVPTEANIPILEAGKR